MKKRFTDEQIIGFLKPAEGGVPVRDYRQHGFSDGSFYTWLAKFWGMTIPDAKRLRDLEVENTQLKKLLVESLLDAEALKIALPPETGRLSQFKLKQGDGYKNYCRSRAQIFIYP